MKKLLCVVMFIFAARAYGQSATCDFCYFDEAAQAATCEEVPEFGTGGANCTGGWTDTHPGLPNGSHCHFAGVPYEGGCYRCGGTAPNNCSTYYPGDDDPDPEEDGCYDAQGKTVPCDPSPIVIRASGTDAWRFDASAWFDIDGDGDIERVSWPAGDAGIVFLAMDRNGNGTIDSGYELWGNYSPDHIPHPWLNGFAWLGGNNMNADGAIDSADAIYTHLLLWHDANADGVSQEGELSPLASSGITSLGLKYHRTSRSKGDASFRYKATLKRGNIAEPYYDVYFRVLE
jgi:hypothetical protein